MGKQRKGERVGTGKVTPVQIAFIVDRYLCDNNYNQTLAAFRSETSTLTSGTKFKEAPKSLLSLSDILDEYITLKEQKISLNHERVSMDREKCRVEKLLQGMQAVIQAYQFVGTASSTSLTPQVKQTPEAYATYKTSLATPLLPLPTVPTNTPNPITTNPSKNKRKCSGSAPGASTAKKSCLQVPISTPASGGTKITSQVSNAASNPKTVQQFYGNSRIESTPYNQNGSSSVQGSLVAKSLFKQTPQPPSDSTGPQTPPQAFPTQTDNSDSPLVDSSLISSSDTMMVTPTNNPVIASENVTEAPSKHTDHSTDRRHLVSSSPFKRSGKRDHIKSRLDFDDSTELIKPENPIAEVLTSASGTELDDMFDDIPDFNILEQDFTLSDFLLEFTLDSDPCPSELTNSLNPVPSYFGVLSERDTNREDPCTLKPSNSTAKSITTNSPGKRERGRFGDQENMLVGR